MTYNQTMFVLIQYLLFLPKTNQLIENDKILLNKWIKGEESAFDDLFKTYYKKLCFAAIRTTENLADAEDMVQELFIEIYNSKSTLKIKGSIKNYLFGALYFKCNAFIKKKIKNTIEITDKVIEISDYSNSPLEYIENIEFETIIYDAIDSLPQKCKEIFELSRFNSLKNKEIAQKLNISIKTVENQMSIALKKLYEKVNPYLSFIAFAVFVDNLRFFIDC